MAYTKYNDPWHDADSSTGGGNETTPLVAAAFNWIEAGIAAAAATADSAKTTADAAIPKAISGVATDKVPVYNGSDWVAQKIVNAQIDAAAAIAISKLAGYPSDATKFARGDGSWAVPTISPTFSAYTPTITASVTNPTLGSGATQIGRYVQIGKLVLGHFVLLLGTGYAGGSGTYYFSLPVAASTASGAIIGTGWVYNGSELDMAVYELNSADYSTCLGRRDYGVGGTGPFSNSDPFVWADSHQIHAQFFYEAA